MAEYIEREYLVDWLNYVDGIIADGTVEAPALYKQIITDIKNFPAADVEKVRHGEWNENLIGFCNVCMACGAIVERTAIKNKSGELNYCPNCGADMRGEKNGKE